MDDKGILSKETDMKKIYALVLISVLVTLSTACAHSDGPYRGKVVELDTGTPIEGAVVAAEWSIEEVPHAQRRCDAKETLTDSNGEFVLPKGTCTSQPFAELSKPIVVVFKPGYLGYPPLGFNQKERKAYMPNFTGQEFKDSRQNCLIELGKPSTRREKELIFSHASSLLHDETAMRKLPNLLRLVNEEGMALGLGKRRGPSDGGGK